MQALFNLISRFLWNPKNCYHVHNCLPTSPILRYRNSGHDAPHHFLMIHFNFILPYTPKFPKCTSSLGSGHQIPVCTSPNPYSCHMFRPCYLSWLEYPKNLLMIAIYKFSRFVFFSNLIVTSSLLGPNIFLSTLFSNTVILCTKRSKPTKCISINVFYPTLTYTDLFRPILRPSSRCHKGVQEMCQ